MTDPSILSSYQDPEGTLKDRLAPRTDMRKYMIDWDIVNHRTVLDLGCNNGYFTREAMRHGAKRAVGVDVSDAILGARELAKGTGAEFWQLNLDSKEFRRYCPRFDVVFLFSVITHLRDKEEFLDWLDGIVKYILIFESNHGEKNKQHIELVKKYLWLEEIEYLGPSDIPEKPHYMWVCKKATHEMRYPVFSETPIEFIPLNRIIRMDDDIVLNQDTTYGVDSDKFKRLKQSIKERGMRDPIIVKRRKPGLYGIFQGGHRFLAAKELGYKEVPCKVVPYRLQRHGV